MQRHVILTASTDFKRITFKIKIKPNLEMNIIEKLSTYYYLKYRKKTTRKNLMNMILTIVK